MLFCGFFKTTFQPKWKFDWMRKQSPACAGDSVKLAGHEAGPTHELHGD